MILAIVGLVIVIVPLGIPAVVLAHLELASIRSGEAPAGGIGYARAAAVMGWLANVMFVVVVAAIAFLVFGLSEL